VTKAVDEFRDQKKVQGYFKNIQFILMKKPLKLHL